MAELAVIIGVCMLVYYVAIGPRIWRNGIEGFEVLAGKRDDLEPDHVTGNGETLFLFALAVGAGLFLLALVGGAGQ